MEPTELTRDDIDKAIEFILREPRKCGCGNRFPAQYQVTSSRGEIWDVMCINAFKK